MKFGGNPLLEVSITTYWKFLIRFYLSWKYLKNLCQFGEISVLAKPNAPKNIVKASFLYPLKTSENLWFQGVWEECLHNIFSCIAKWPAKQLDLTYTEIFSKLT